MNVTQRTKSADEFVHRFMKDFYNRFGVYPRVNYSLGNSSRSFTLKDLKDIINHLIFNDERITRVIKNPNLSSRSRLRELVIYRQCFCKIGTDMNYGPSIISSQIDYNHSTVIYSSCTINHLLEIKDKLTIETINKIEDELQKRFGSGEIIQDTGRTKDKSEPALDTI
jgi:chromosomal replication initiation ATPase DnaA